MEEKDHKPIPKQIVAMNIKPPTIKTFLWK